ncbi:MAG TPA: GerMN domain-containing protein [Vicinamibacterales bacterium]|nr:GerMN domain-containing protein [Vicinamibacterales bacterium]
MRRPSPLALVVTLAALGGGWLLLVALPRWYGPRQPSVPAEAAPAPPPARRITARLFHVAENGLELAAVEREVPYAESTAAQARLLVEEQLKPPPPPYASAIPPGTRLRALFITSSGEAFVDFSGEIAAAHPGGSREELFTVYAIVNAVTANLPAVSAVQILVDGREVDTLAGHVDLRRPLPGTFRLAGAKPSP